MMLDIIARGMAAKALQIGAPTDKQIMDSLSVLAENGKITTGATEEQAAQIEQNTAGIHMLSAMLESDINSQGMWESGQINSDGTNGANNARIRTIGYIPDNVVRVKTDGQANVRAQLYAADGTFVKVSALGFTQDFMVADVLAENEQAAKIRLTIQHVKTTTVIDTSYSEHVHLIALTDTDLSAAGKSADAAATGAAITALKETITVPVSRISGLAFISPNLIDIDSCTVGKNINTSGEIVDNESTMITDYIEVPLGTDCWITKNCNPNGTNGIYACALYSEDKNFITRLYNSTTLSSFGIAAGKNCKYVRLAMYTAATDTMAVLDIQSDQPTYTDLPYSEFGEKWIEYDYLSKWLDDVPTGDAITQIITDYPNSGDHPLDHIIRDGGMCGIFRTIGVVGDSLSSGLLEYKNSEGETQGVDCYEHSWIKHIGRICGSTAHNFSVGGLKASTFWTTTNAKVKLLRDADENYKCDAYFIALGVNDIADENIEVGSSADIANDESTTFYGYYSRIIKLIQTIQPRAKIFLVGLPNDSKMTAWGSRFTNFKNAVADMVNYFDNCYYLDLYTYEKPYNSDFHEIYFNGFHENVLGYLRTAWIISSYVDWIVRNHYTEFREAGFIGTDYHYYNS